MNLRKSKNGYLMEFAENKYELNYTTQKIYKNDIIQVNLKGFTPAECGNEFLHFLGKQS